MSTLYAPGKTPVAVTPRGFAVLEAGASAALLARIRALLADGRGLGGVIEALTGAYGASLTAIPAFAVALEEADGVRVAVRGDFAFDINATTPERVSGAGVTTWTERVIPGVTRVALSTADDVASAPAELEIVDGIVLVAGLVRGAAAVSAASSAPGDAGSPAPDAAPSVRRRRDDAPTGPISVPATAPASLPDPASAPEPGIADSEPAAEPAPGPENPAPATAAVPASAGPETDGEPPVRGPWSSRVASDGPVSDGAAPVAGLIDSSAVASVADAETLLPLDSALSPHAAGAAGAGTASGAPAGARGEEEVASTTGYDHLWGATVIRSVEDAAVRPEGEDEGEASAPSDGSAPPAGDHDGATISLAQARALRDAANGGAGAAGSAELPAEGIAPPLAPPRPPAPGRIRVSTGQVLPLDRTVVIGRRPRSTRVSGTDLPHLVAVDSPEQDISRSHVELRVEGESIVATDLRTTNGTTLLRSGADPVRLHPGEGTVVVPGDVLDLGDGITVAIEALT